MLDYDALTAVLMFAACEKRRCETIIIIEDNVAEPMETFNVTLEEVPGLDARITLDPVEAVVEIIDSNSQSCMHHHLLIYCLLCAIYTVAVVGLEMTFYNVSEDVGVVEVCAIVISPNTSCPISFPFDVRLSTRDRSAGTTAR